MQERDYPTHHDENLSQPGRHYIKKGSCCENPLNDVLIVMPR